MNPKAFSRIERINEQMHRELAVCLSTGIKNPGLADALKRVTITAVDVSNDYAHARIFYTVLGASSEDRAIVRALHVASSFLRRELAHRLRLHHIPELHFKYDESVVRGVRLSQLIDDAVRCDTERSRENP